MMIFILTVAQVPLHCVYWVISRNPLSQRPICVSEYGWVVSVANGAGIPKTKILVQSDTGYQPVS